MVVSHRPTESDWRTLALVGAGILAGFILVVFQINDSLDDIFGWSIALAVSLGYVAGLLIMMILALLYGLGILSEKKLQKTRKERWQGTIMIGILNDIPWTAYTKSSFASNIKPENWEQLIRGLARDKKLFVDIRYISVKEDFEPFVAILNPYGGTYPEVNVGEGTTLRKIISFVENGGLFVNVSDVPTYYVYGLTLKKVTDNTPALYNPVSIGDITLIGKYRPFDNTPLIKELALDIVTFDSGTQYNLVSEDRLSEYTKCWMTYRRAVKVASNIESCAEPLFVVEYKQPLVVSDSYEISPLFYVSFGEGRFLISLGYVNDEFHTNDDCNVIAHALVNMILNTIIVNKERKRSG